LASVVEAVNMASTTIGPHDFAMQGVVGTGPETLTVLNPVAIGKGHGIRLAERLDTLEGKRIAFFWNCKPGGDVALRRAEERLRERFPNMVAGQLSYEHHRGGEVIPLPEILPFKPDAVIVSTADCAISVGAATDLVELESLGIPTVVIVTKHFLSAVQEQARFCGLIEPLRTAVVPDALTNITTDQIRVETDDALEDVIDGLLSGSTLDHSEESEELSVDRIEFRGTTPCDLFEGCCQSKANSSLDDGVRS
jgi:hypothetical protein